MVTEAGWKADSGERPAHEIGVPVLMSLAAEHIQADRKTEEGDHLLPQPAGIPMRIPRPRRDRDQQQPGGKRHPPDRGWPEELAVL